MRKLVHYVKFNLPTGGSGIPAKLVKNRIYHSVKSVCDLQGIPFSTETQGYTLDIHFDNYSDLCLFMLSYDQVSHKCRVVSY